jgi:LmbE family N-acetylglucosaminyl deacetylase
MARLHEENHEVKYVAFSDSKKSNPGQNLWRECVEAINYLLKVDPIILDYETRVFSDSRQPILQYLVDCNKRYHPDAVLCPSSSSLHQDHKVICEEAMRAFRRSSSILGYELPYDRSFNNDINIRLEEQQVEAKISALKKYGSQNQRSYMRPELIRGHAMMRGAETDNKYAESFEALKIII